MLALAPARAADGANRLAVIVSKDSPVSVLTAADLKKIFLGEKTKGDDGVKYVIALRSNGTADHAAALQLVFGMSEAALTKHFLAAAFTGVMPAPPKQLPTAAALKKYVALTPGAIGYVQADQLDDTVKAVPIDGKAPGEAGYPLIFAAK